METITILNSTECDRLMKWCDSQELEKEIFTGRETCRRKKWWGYEAEFYFNKSHCFERERIESDSYLKELRDRFKPEANSILLYRYESGGEIGEHLDKQCFERWVTLINLVDSEPDLFGDREATKFRWNRQNYYLQHGEVVVFDSRVTHSIPKLKVARYSLQFRVV